MRFQVIFFDMNGTFMFGHDRLGRDQDDGADVAISSIAELLHLGNA